jgi:hypothetical protein
VSVLEGKQLRLSDETQAAGQLNQDPGPTTVGPCRRPCRLPWPRSLSKTLTGSARRFFSLPTKTAPSTGAGSTASRLARS